MPTRTVRLIFWIIAGTSQTAEIVEVAKNSTEVELRDKLERWCSRFSSWRQGNNDINYGYDKAPKYSKLGRVEPEKCRSMVFRHGEFDLKKKVK